MDTEIYNNAMASIKAEDYQAAQRSLKMVLDTMDKTEALYQSVQVCYGMMQVFNGESNGLLRCRDGASVEHKLGDVFLYLACAEVFSKNRKRAIDAITQGLKLDSKNEKLIRASRLIECRKKNVISFLPREHPLNKFLGCRLRRGDNFPSISALLA